LERNKANGARRRRTLFLRLPKCAQALSCEKAQQQHHSSNVNGNGSTAATSAQHSTSATLQRQQQQEVAATATRGSQVKWRVASSGCRCCSLAA